MSSSTSSMGDITKVSIPTFGDGPKDNYFTWRARMRMIFTTKKCWGIVSGTEVRPVITPGQGQVEAASPAPTGTAVDGTEFHDAIGTTQVTEAHVNDFKSRQATAASLLLQGVTDNVMTDLMMHLEDPTRMWDILESKYNSSTSTKILSILTSIINMSAESNVNVNDHAMKLEALYCQLTNIEQSRDEGKIEVTGDVFKTCILLSQLKKTGRYDAVIESIRGNGTTAQETPSYEQVKNRLVEAYHEQKQGIGGSGSGSPSIMSQRNPRRFHNRAGPAHFAKKSDIECHYCHKKGHVKKDCYSNPNGDNYRNKNNINKSNGSGKGGKFVAFARAVDENPGGVQGSGVNGSSLVTRDGAKALSASRVLQKDMKESKKMCVPELILDSGATDHVCSDARLFGWIAYRRPKKIIAGNGEGIIVTRGGVLHVTNEHGSKICLTDVLYCPEFQTNVVSVSQMANNAGWTTEFCKDQVVITTSEGEVVVRGKHVNGLYQLKVRYAFKEKYNPKIMPGMLSHLRTRMESGTKNPGSDLWHERMGHPGLAVIDNRMLLRK